MEIQGLIAVVTGGGSGLGRATALRLAAAGAKVAIADLARSPGAEVAAELGEQGLFLATDVTSEAEVTALLDAAQAKWGGVARIVVNCAGIGTVGKTVGREGPLPLEVFTRTLMVNTVGSFNVIRLAAARMAGADVLETGERGVCINTASVAAYEGQIGQVSYAASKGAIVAMTLPIARDLARDGIRVMTIAPGLFKTPMLAGLPEKAQESLGQQVPFPSRLGDPAEYAQLAEAIVRNPMLNGTTIRLDGAIRMAPR
ncbi:MAG: SDR family NAD(P)-dependent oxidoreductase [Myxococcota bacterium]